MISLFRIGLYAASGLLPAAFLVATERPSRAGRGAGFAPNEFPNVVLRTHEGKEVRFYDDLLKGKAVVLNFFYTKCQGVCPKTTENLLEVQRILGDRVGRDLFFYSISLKPSEDTPERLRAHAEAVGAGPGWLFLTGDADDIEIVRRRVGFVDRDPEVDKDTSQHVGMVLYGNEARQSWAACPGESSPDLLAEQFLWMVPQRQETAGGAGSMDRGRSPSLPGGNQK